MNRAAIGYLMIAILVAIPVGAGFLSFPKVMLIVGLLTFLLFVYMGVSRRLINGKSLKGWWRFWE